MIKINLKTNFAAAVSIAVAGFMVADIANASPLPAPPTEAYQAPATSDCQGETLSVYFPAGTSALTPASRALLEAMQTRLEGCILGPVSLTATANDAPSATVARTLSEARIETVRGALDDYQLNGMTVNAQHPSPAQAPQVILPTGRTVEIQLAAWAPEIS